jgi:hypothetical protein
MVDVGDLAAGAVLDPGLPGLTVLGSEHDPVALAQPVVLVRELDLGMRLCRF